MDHQIDVAVHYYAELAWYWQILIGGVVGSFIVVFAKILAYSFSGDVNYFEPTYTKPKKHGKNS